MSRRDNSHLDVLVLGEHPATYFTAALLRKASLKVLHATLPTAPPPDRLVLVNADFFELHPMLAPLRKKLDLAGIYGLQFLSDDVAIKSEHRAKSFLSLVGRYKDVRAGVIDVAEQAGVPMLKPADVQIHNLDETGLDATIGNETIRAKALILGGAVSEPQAKLLGLPEAWEPEVMFRYCFARLKRGCQADVGTRPIGPMSLDLNKTLCWGWLLPHGQQAQLSVAIPMKNRALPPAVDLIKHWVAVLRQHKVLSGGGEMPVEEIQTLELPLAGAMAHEGVANRTLLVGPAGGFYSACAEDIYPNCWSALFAVDTIRKALKEPYLQDALQLYRHKWRTTLGEYLRGPQQNLRFLLPLVYRNQVMTSRLTESILQGKSVVR